MQTDCFSAAPIGDFAAATLREREAFSALVGVSRPFLSAIQWSVMVDGCRGEEGGFFVQQLINLAEQIASMPSTGQQDGKGDQAMVHLHYFLNDSDWYILEKDVDGGVHQAFGYAVLDGDDEMAELGYISIAELTRYGVELDLHFVPCTLAAIKAKRAGLPDDPENPNPWVVVTRCGQDDESIWADYPTYRKAVAALGEPGERADVMRRLPDGSLTSDY